MEPANRRPAPDAGSAALPAFSSVTGEQDTVGSRQIRSSEGGAKYAALLVGPVAPCQASRPLKPTAMDSDPLETGVSSEKTNRRMSSDMSGALSDNPDGTTQHAQVTNTCLPAGELPNKTLIFITGVKGMLRAPLLSWLGCGRHDLAV